MTEIFLFIFSTAIVCLTVLMFAGIPILIIRIIFHLFGIDIMEEYRNWFFQYSDSRYLSLLCVLLIMFIVGTFTLYLFFAESNQGYLSFIYEILLVPFSYLSSP